MLLSKDVCSLENPIIFSARSSIMKKRNEDGAIRPVGVVAVGEPLVGMSRGSLVTK